MTYKLPHKRIRFDVKDNPELNKAIQNRLFQLGSAWCGSHPRELRYPNAAYIVTGYTGTLSYGSQPYKKTDCCTVDEVWTLNDLYDPKKLNTSHIIEIDGKEISISEESYQAFKKQFT